MRREGWKRKKREDAKRCVRIINSRSTSSTANPNRKERGQREEKNTPSRSPSHFTWTSVAFHRRASKAGRNDNKKKKANVNNHFWCSRYYIGQWTDDERIKGRTRVLPEAQIFPILLILSPLFILTYMISNNSSGGRCSSVSIMRMESSQSVLPLAL